jgi:hypothetical protein
MKELDVIKLTSILNESDFNFLTQVSDELADTLKKRQMFRTETEMAISVLDDIHYPTPAAKYWQSVREQAGMFEALVSTSFQYRRNEVQIKRVTKRLEECTDEFDREEAQIELDECLFKRASMEFESKDRIRELKLWSQIKKELDDGSFDTTDVNTHQLVSYAQRFILQASNAPENMPVAEANNLMGQLQTTIKELSQQNLLEQVLRGLPQPIVDRVLVDKGIVHKIAPPEIKDAPQTA